MRIENNISLKDYNTFSIDVVADRLIECETIEELRETIAQTGNDRRLILGGGSNVLFLNDFHGTIIRPLIDGINVVDESSDAIKLRVAAGVDFDYLVEFCVENNYQGLENLSLIPGKVGAAPVQNIGAYGVEVGNVIYSVEGLYLDSGEKFEIVAEECKFGYRNSIFKQELKGKTVITHVNFVLKKNNFTPNINYGDVRKAVEELGGNTIQNVRQAIIQIRQAKLPDPKITGNAGSFFKNPEIPTEQFWELQKKFDDIPSYVISESIRKIPAAWLIEKSGWKGKTLGNVAVHHIQPLVLVNLGGATGAEIIALAEKVCGDVERNFGIRLETEVNKIG